MDELKPEDDMKADRNDRRAGRSRQSSERDADPQINFDDVDLDDADDGRPTRGSKARRERDEEQYEEQYEEDVESDEDDAEERQVERRPRKRKKAPAKPASRQYIMMGVGILVLLLLIVGVGSALKSPSSSSGEQTASGEKSVSLSGDQDNNAQPTAQDSSATNNSQPQDVSLPPIASNPTQGQATTEPQGQQRVEVQGDLNNALTQQQGQIDSAVANSTLPTEPATVAPLRNGAAPRQATTERQTAATPTPRPTERKHTVIEPKPQATAKTTAEPKPTPVQPKRVESVATTAPAKATPAQPTKPVATAQTKPTQPTATTTTPAATATATAPAATAAASKSAGDVGSMKSAPSGHYTLQLSSSSNYNNLNSWAKKEKLEKYVVYETTRNGQPWYVLVSGIYASKDEAKRAVATLPADVQAKNPWAKPLHQVQSDLK
ncbi:cell division protein DamX [Klebsiella sp. RHBSTW-00484]|uniref:cell division protein DamX n=1 Tax=unclassified Klebsiella TaxID=2608929 RepID=UPI0015E57C89|nr:MULTISPECIES: cell division protein DamX [unclassified Klebsiella]MBA7844820.1 cell division protein DamX [Klebsiella sp. RHBSTW-00465]QLO34736.1 cell division protein DamX [Klebsiella sp. RHBSTW-00484]QLT74250.1 cell division protein DamX [Klebsiella sp. RHBSTW-00464]